MSPLPISKHAEPLRGTVYTVKKATCRNCGGSITLGFDSRGEFMARWLHPGTGKAECPAS